MSGMDGLSDEEYRRAVAVTVTALDGLPVRVKTLHEVLGASQGYANPLEELVLTAPPAYSLEAVVLGGGVNLLRCGRFGFTEHHEVTPWPVALDAEDAAERLREVLAPKVAEQQAIAEADRVEGVASGGPVEARDAVKRVG